MKRFGDKVILTLIAGTLVLIVLTSFGSGGHAKKLFNTKRHTFQLPAEPIQSGDLIFRNGRGMISRTFRAFNRKSPLYSHAGIIHVQNGKIYVIHLIDGGSRDGQIQMEPIQKFCSYIECSLYGIYRTKIDGERINLAALSFVMKGIHFDSAFDLVSDDRMYCTEFVYKSLQTAAPDFFLPLNSISGKPYVACDDLFLASGNHQVFTFSY